MSADFERQVNEHLSQLRSEVDQVRWAESATVRRRGSRRQVHRAATTGLAVVAGVGLLSYSAVAGIPGTQQITPAGEQPVASTSGSVRQSTPTAPGSPSRPTSEATLHAPTGEKPRSGPPSTHKTGKPNPPHTRSGTPVAPPTGTSSSSPTNTPEAPSPPTGTPSTPPSTPATLTTEALLVAAEMPQVNDSDTRWSPAGTSESEGGEASVCQAGSVVGLGAIAVVRRDYTWGTEGTVTGTNVVGQFNSAEDAADAYDSYRGWLDGCGWGTPHGPTGLSGVGDAAAWWWFGRENADGSGEIEVVGLVRSGTGLSVVVWREGGQDLIYETDPMAAPLAAAVARLKEPGDGGAAPADSPPPVEATPAPSTAGTPAPGATPSLPGRTSAPQS